MEPIQNNLPYDIQLNSANNKTFERKIWYLYILKIFIIMTTLCQACWNNCINFYKLKEKNFSHYIRSKYINNFIYYNMWIGEYKNSVEIYNKIKSESNTTDIIKDKMREIFGLLRH